MNIQHRELAQGRWHTMPFVEQMANIGSEIERAINWKTKNNAEYCQKAFERALELIDLTIEDSGKLSRVKELVRMREAAVDFFAGTNQYSSTVMSWKKYFMCFTYAARRNY